MIECFMRIEGHVQNSGGAAVDSRVGKTLDRSPFLALVTDEARLEIDPKGMRRAGGEGRRRFIIIFFDGPPCRRVDQFQRVGGMIRIINDDAAIGDAALR